MSRARHHWQTLVEDDKKCLYPETNNEWQLYSETDYKWQINSEIDYEWQIKSEIDYRRWRWVLLVVDHDNLTEDAGNKRMLSLLYCWQKKK